LAAIGKTSPIATTRTLQPAVSRRMNIAEYTLIDCATGLSSGPFELVDRARHRAEIDNIAKWEIINCDSKLVAWSKPEAA
jgi:hypothetical protein